MIKNKNFVILVRNPNLFIQGNPTCPCMNLDEVNERGASPAQAFIKDNFGGWAWDADNTAIQFKVSTTQPEVSYH